jgi:hypothetical protein
LILDKHISERDGFSEKIKNDANEAEDDSPFEDENTNSLSSEKKDDFKIAE